MSTLPDKFVASSEFMLGVELVSTRGTVLETRASKTLGFSQELARYAPIDWVSITDNAGLPA